VNSFSIAADLSCLASRPITGVGYYTGHLFDALLRQSPGLDLRVFACAAKPMPEEVHGFGARTSRFSGPRVPTRLKNGLWTRAEWPPMSWWLGETDIVHGGFHLLPPSRTAKRMVTIFDLAGMRRSAIHEDASLALHRKLLTHAVPRADGIVAISQSCRADVIELLNADPAKVHVVPGGVMLEEFSGPLDEARLADARQCYGVDGPYWIHLGTLEPRKNLKRLVDAYARLRARHEVPRLVLAGGEGWMFGPVLEAITRHGLEKEVIRTGYLPREDAVALLRGAQGCVYPSLYEGFGLPVLEAMAARVPVLTSDVSSLPEVIGDTGILVEPEDEGSLDAGLERLLLDRGTESARVEAAWSRAQGMTWDHSAQALMAAYRAVLERP
jgi:glycosyltransferase involved in cell wall biosynthesis